MALDLSINLHLSMMKEIVEPQIASPETITMTMLNHPKKNPNVSNGTQPTNELTLHMFHVMIEQQFVYLEEMLKINSTINLLETIKIY